MSRVTLMQSSVFSPSRNHVHQMKLAAVVPPSIYKLETLSKKTALMPPILHLHFFNPVEPIIYNSTSQNSPASSVCHPVMFCTTVDVSNVIPLQFIILDFKEQLFDSIQVEPCAHGTQVKISISCINKMVVDSMMAAIMRNLPSAEFGHIKRA